MPNTNLTQAKKAKNDEFYTRYHDIEKEMNAYLDMNENVFRDKTILLPCDDPEWSCFTDYFAESFDRLGLKKLISTSYAPNSKSYDNSYTVSLFEEEDPNFDEVKTKANGKIYTLTRGNNPRGRKDFYNVEWQYLEGDGDFRSEEVTKLRDEADIIITNPPFSLFREFLAWINEGNKQFAIIGNMNGITYKEVFPLIKDNKMWLGATNFNNGMYFHVPSDFVYANTYKFERELNGKKVSRVPSICWFSNIEHGRRHEPMMLMNMADNLRYNKQLIKSEVGYKKYDNYDAIEVPFNSAIPSDYEGVMGVPISFLNKYNPEQFEIVGCSYSYGRPKGWNPAINMGALINGINIYKRILIKHKNLNN